MPDGVAGAYADGVAGVAGMLIAGLGGGIAIGLGTEPMSTEPDAAALDEGREAAELDACEAT